MPAGRYNYITVIGCSKVVSIYSDDNTSNVNVLENVALELSSSIEYFAIRRKNTRKINEFWKSFELTDMRHVRKMSLYNAVRLGIVAERMYERLKEKYPEDSFVLLIRDKWFKDWQLGSIQPHEE